jgi:DNA end-binding protein Ku
MAARPTWRGHLRLALVACPIRLLPATTGADKIRFHKLNRETNNRLRMQMIDSETGDVVPSEDTVMGYEFEKGRYVTVEKEEIDRLKIDSSEIINIERVVPAADVDPLYWDTPYIVEPDGKTGLDIFATIREALHAKDVVGIGRAVMSRRERPVLVQSRGKGMMISTLLDPDEVRKPEEYFDEIPDVKVDKQNLEMAGLLIEKMEGPFDLTMFEDRYQKALQALVEAKMKGQKPVVAEEPERPTNVVNLFDALKASLEGAGGRAAAKPRARAKPSRKADTARKTDESKATKTKRRKRA